jgi:hypothetical protein
VRRTRGSRQQTRSARSKCHRPTTPADQTCHKCQPLEATMIRRRAAAAAMGTKMRTICTRRCLKAAMCLVATAIRSVDTMQLRLCPIQRQCALTQHNDTHTRARARTHTHTHTHTPLHAFDIHSSLALITRYAHCHALSRPDKPHA